MGFPSSNLLASISSMTLSYILVGAVVLLTLILGYEVIGNTNNIAANASNRCEECIDMVGMALDGVPLNKMKMKAPVNGSHSTRSQTAAGELPVFAYYLTGTMNDGPAMVRLLMALYHPRNQYLLHLEKKASSRDRNTLTKFVRDSPVFAKVGNVHVMPESNLVTYRGVTMVVNYLHGAAVLLRQRQNWDWYINLSAADYPLMRQDDLIHAFSTIPREFNFVSHYSDLGFKVETRAEPIVTDPALWDVNATEIQRTCDRRKQPTSFKLFTGSAWVVLSRAFIEYSIWGWDNLPRLLLLYYANYISSPEGYFQTLICNSEFRHTVVNSDLHYIRWLPTGGQNLDEKDFNDLASIGVPFARKFLANATILDIIDSKMLQRSPGHLIPGGWCGGGSNGEEDPCSAVGDPSALQPGEGARKLQAFLSEKTAQPTSKGTNVAMCT